MLGVKPNVSSLFKDSCLSITIKGWLCGAAMLVSSEDNLVSVLVFHAVTKNEEF